MKTMKNRLMFLISISVVFAAVLCAYALQTRATSKIKGVTIISRRYEIKADGTVVELGKQNTYISMRGAWRTVKTGPDGKIEQVLVADAAHSGVFSIDTNKHAASKLASFKPKDTAYLDAEGYRNHPQFAGEETILGFKGYIQRLTTPEGQINSDLTYIPEFDTLPVKEVDYLDDGSKLITEPLSIIAGEPADTNFHIPPDMPMKDTLLDQKNQK